MNRFDDVYARISSPEVKQACDDLLAYFSGRGDFEPPKPLISGPKKAVHFCWNGKDIYGFIANNHWLLWYFRKPGATAGAFSFESVQASFPSANFTVRKNPNIKEISMKITNREEARQVIEFAHGHPQPS